MAFDRKAADRKAASVTWSAAATLLFLAGIYLIRGTLVLALGLTYVIGSRVATEARQPIAHPPDIRGFLASLVLAHPALAPLIDPIRGSVSAQLGAAAAALPRVSLSLLEHRQISSISS